MRKILIVIDMQNDFIDGALGTAEAVSIVAAVAEKIGQYEAGNVYATRDTHHSDYLQTLEGQLLPVPHCIKDSEGWQLRAEIAEQLAKKQAVIVDKPTFGSYELVRQLLKEQSNEPAEFELVGLCTDICVASNALLLRAALPDAVIKVTAACCAGTAPNTHEAALTTMKSCQIQVL